MLIAMSLIGVMWPLLIKPYRFNPDTCPPLPGITYLRDYLHLPQEIVPSTLKRAAARTNTAAPRARMQGGAPGAGPKSDDRDAYRSAEGKQVGPGQEFQPEFVSV